MHQSSQDNHYPGRKTGMSHYPWDFCSLVFSLPLCMTRCCSLPASFLEGVHDRTPTSAAGSSWEVRCWKWAACIYSQRSVLLLRSGLWGSYSNSAALATSMVSPAETSVAGCATWKKFPTLTHWLYPGCTCSEEWLPQLGWLCCPFQ